MADIRVVGVRQNNLKNLTVEIPAKALTVVTGPSGSGKSSLAFDTLYAEGQRRYIESLSTYVRQFLEKMPKPDLDEIYNIPPAIALEQRNSILNSRSTVGTQTEILDYLRVLFARIGETRCLDCNGKVQKIHAETILEAALEWFPGRKALMTAPFVLVQPGATRSKSKTLPSVDSIIKVIREQGIRRLLKYPVKTPAKSKPKAKLSPEVLDLDEFGQPGFPKLAPSDFDSGSMHFVLDRLKVSPSEAKNPETQSRLADSISQALLFGHDRLAFYDLDNEKFKAFDCRFACVDCGRQHIVPEPNLFSFNSPLGACSHCNGFGHTLDLDETLVVPDPSKTLKNGAVDPLSKPSMDWWQRQMFRFVEKNGISIGKRYRELTAGEKKLIWTGKLPGETKADKNYPGLLGIFEELGAKKYKIHVRVFIRRYQSQTLCHTCEGARLKPEALAVRISGHTLPEWCALPIERLDELVSGLKLKKSEAALAKDALDQVRHRLHMLNAVGVGYLTLARLAKSLSGGEYQRICLATQLGHGLCGTLYVLDEPSIGLHASDTDRLIRVLKNLRDQGNTVLVVEHDTEVIKAADHVLELGPGSGRRGGELMAAASPAELAKTANSLTGKYLSGELVVAKPKFPRGPARSQIKITGCREHNLQNVTLEIPLERLTVVTGVSGSGKSTLIHKTLFPALTRVFTRPGAPGGMGPEPGAFDQLYGAELISAVTMLDQRPIGRSSRSNPATYLKAWDEIRRIYANQVLSLRRGYTAQHFSFNVDGGRCPVCKGEGEVTVDMHFMAEMKLPCEECQGRRFKKDVLDITVRGKSVYQLLESTIDEAYDMFRDNSVLLRKFGLLRDVGLGYLQVGQSGATLSGGESQRLKIAAALEEKSMARTLYLFDEPTTGLHLDDIRKLIPVFQDLVDARHTVVIIEHHMDVISQADWLIDVGPGGGERGGKIVAAGTPAQVARTEGSVTGQLLQASPERFPPEALRAVNL